MECLRDRIRQTILIAEISLFTLFGAGLILKGRLKNRRVQLFGSFFLTKIGDQKLG